jgi:hypothetical protein
MTYLGIEQEEIRISDTAWPRTDSVMITMVSLSPRKALASSVRKWPALRVGKVAEREIAWKSCAGAVPSKVKSGFRQSAQRQARSPSLCSPSETGHILRGQTRAIPRPSTEPVKDGGKRCESVCRVHGTG